MAEILLFIKDFEMGSKISSICVDNGRDVEFSDENTDPNLFKNSLKLAIVDMDEKVFLSIGLVSELKRRGLKVIGILDLVNNKTQKKLRNAGCDIILPRLSILKNISNLLDELLD